MTNQFVLAYYKDNEITAHEIERELRLSGFKFEHLVCTDKKEDLDFNQRLSGVNKQIVLLVSDNSLKSLNGMHNIGQYLSEPIKSGQIQVIVTDGYYSGNADEPFERVPTIFDRIGQIIKYMNNWQEEYLNQRNKVRQAEGDEKALIEESLKITRGVSTQVGEFLRFLREADYWEYALLRKGNYQAFFKTYADEATYQSFLDKYAAQSESGHPASIPNSAKDSEDIQATPPEEELPEENAELLPNDLQLEDIPGIDLLGSSAPSLGNTPSVESPSSGFKVHQEATPFPAEVETLISEEPPNAVANPSIDPKVEIEKTPVPEKIKIEFNQNLDEILEEVAEEESVLAGQEKVQKGDKKKSFDILQSIFDDDEEQSLEEISANAPVEEPLPEMPPEKSSQNIPDLIETGATANMEEVDKFQLLANEAESKNDLLLAKSYYEKINSLNPDLEDVNFKLGMISATCFSNQEKQAAAYLKKTLKLNPKNINARYHYAVLLAETLNKPKKAAKHFITTLNQQPDHPFANYDLALLYHRKGNVNDAREYYEQAFHINPELKTEENDLAFNYVDQAEENLQKDQMQKSLYPESEWLRESEEIEVVDLPEEEIEEEDITFEKVDFGLEETKPQKTVLITGATSGIGLATAKVFAANGYRLVLTGRRAEKLQQVQEDLKANHNTTSLILNFDVRNKAAIPQALEALQNEWGQIDILINNAGLAKGYGPIHEGKIEDWEAMIDTNIKGLLYMTRAIAPKMVHNKSGHIINIASTAGKEVYPNGNVYCATKFAVDALTQSMRLDLHKHNIRVSQVAPGHVEETEFALVRFDGDADRSKIYEDFQPLRSKDVAEAIYFIATRPPHVNVQDILMMGTQQASNNHIHRSGRT